MCAQASNQSGTSGLDAALAYARVGCPVLPLKPGSKAPNGRLVPNGWHDATTDPDTIRRWCASAPNMNLGIACAPSGLVAVDVDRRHGGDDQFHDLERELGPLPDDTPRSLTGDDGLHVLLKHPGVPLVGRLAPGVEIKDAGYIVAPPSLHPHTGRRYEWEIDPFDTPLAPIPPAWLARMKASVAPPPRRAKLSDTDDILRELLPAEYVKDIARLRPNRAGYVRCPSPTHEDRTPSLRVYDTAEAGWYCYGCQRGGDIFEFAALVRGQAPRPHGVEFLRLEQALHALYTALWQVAA